MVKNNCGVHMSLNNIIRLKIVGFIFIIVATIVATVIIPKNDACIDKIDDRIDDFKESRILTVICGISYDIKFTQRRIELFEANENVSRKNNDSSIKILRERALENTIGMAKAWASLLGREQKEVELAKLDKEIEKIINDKSKNINKKIEAVEKIYQREEELASARLKKAHEKYYEDKQEKQKKEDINRRWNSFFILFQILGLMILSICEILDKFALNK